MTTFVNNMASNEQGKAVLQRVSKGGFWHSASLDYSKETQDRLSDVMREAKLTLAQQREMKNVLKEEPKPSTSQYKKNFKGKNPFVGSASRKSLPVIKKTNYGIRSKDTIEKSGVYEVDKLPSLAEKPVREKERLQNLMAYGKDLATEKKKEEIDDFEPAKFPTPKERFEQIVSEIEERKQFLAEMKELGVENKYSAIINNQLAEKLRELELLDQEAKLMDKQSD